MTTKQKVLAVLLAYAAPLGAIAAAVQSCAERTNKEQDRAIGESVRGLGEDQDEMRRRIQRLEGLHMHPDWAGPPRPERAPTRYSRGE